MNFAENTEIKIYNKAISCNIKSIHIGNRGKWNKNRRKNRFFSPRGECGGFWLDASEKFSKIFF